jgi:hypothetical protein
MDTMTENPMNNKSMAHSMEKFKEYKLKRLEDNCCYTPRVEMKQVQL